MRADIAGNRPARKIGYHRFEAATAGRIVIRFCPVCLGTLTAMR